MLVFPQLSTGAVALYPLIKTSRQRSTVNTLGDGTTYSYADPDAASLGWELHGKGMTASEWGQIEALYEATSGMWQAFTFLDPVGNLLAQSETFGASCWTNGALIALTTDANDPLGTTRATEVTNAGLATQSIGQTLPVPGTFQFCASIWARTDSGTNLSITISTTGATITKSFSLGTQWVRVSLAANLAQSTDSVTFAVGIPAGGTAVLFGFQVEAQQGSSDYKQTGIRGGVFPNARFGTDTLAVTAQGTDVFDVVLQIVNMEN